MRRVGCVHIFFYLVCSLLFFFLVGVLYIGSIVLSRRIACFNVHVICKSLVCMIIFLSIYYCICSFTYFIITIGL